MFIAWPDPDNFYDYSINLVNYEISGNEIDCYNALRNEVSEDVWVVASLNLDSPNLPVGTVVTRITQTFPLRNDQINHDLRFENDTFTLTLDNEAKNRISLLFKDGFWEVLEATGSYQG
jgi:hypothetical protein